MNINEDEVYTWEMAKLWTVLNILNDESDGKIKKKYLEEFKEINKGVKTNIPIWYFIYDWYEEQPKAKRVKVIGFGKYHIEVFMQEKEERENLMRRIIIDNMPEDNMIGRENDQT